MDRGAIAGVQSPELAPGLSHQTSPVPLAPKAPHGSTRHAGYGSIELSLAAAHPLRGIRAITDRTLDRLAPEICASAACSGHPLERYRLAFKATLLCALYGISSQHHLVDELTFNRLYTWFLGGDGDPVQFDPLELGALCHQCSRHPMLSRYMQDVLAEAEAAGLLSYFDSMTPYPLGAVAGRTADDDARLLQVSLNTDLVHAELRAFGARHPEVSRAFTRLRDLTDRWSELLAYQVQGREYATCVVVLAIGYVAFYGGLLIATDGLPYVLDNNETFSSLWHASNLFHFGLEKSFGLTDEAYGFSPAAHPYVHTHQGNVPRAFAFLIYLFGARTAESQIVVTTFAIGLAVVFMAFHFFQLITGSRFFALLATILIFSDYLVIAQWQVVTYRVWHGFFMFSTLLCVHGMAGTHRWRWWGLALINHAALFYFELIFVAFVTILAAAYAAFLFRNRLARLLWLWAAQGCGAAMGLGLLAVQLILYMGWDALVQDAYLTFVARNHATDDPDLALKLREFYESRNIVFWYNLAAAQDLRTIPHFLASLSLYDFQPHTPHLVLAMCVAVLAWLVGFASRPDAGGSPERTRLSWHEVLALVAPLALVAVHLGHRVWREDFGRWQVWSFGLVGAVLIVLFALRRHAARTTRGNAPSMVQDHIWSLMGLAILGAGLVSIAEHVSLTPGVFERFSPLFVGYLALYLALAVVLAASVRSQAPGGAHSRDPVPEKTRDRITRLTAGALLFGAIFATTGLALTGSFAFGLIPLETMTSALRGLLRWEMVGSALALYLLAIPRLDVGDSGRRDRLHRLLPPVEHVGAANRLTIYLLLVCALIIAINHAYNPPYALLWQEFNASLGSDWPLRAFLALVIIVGARIVLVGTTRVFSAATSAWFRGLLLFVGTGLFAYAIVFWLSPGYVYSGYRYRLVPITAFHTLVLFAAGTYILFHGVRWAPEVSIARQRGPARTPAARPGLKRTGLGPWPFRSVAAGMVVVAVLLYWAHVQANWMRVLPADHFSAVLKRLAKPPYVGESFVVNTYAAPVAAYTGQWAYYDPALGEGRLDPRAAGPRLRTDHIYLWLADKETNEAYKTPRYFLCLTPQSVDSVIVRLRAEREGAARYPGCSESGLVRLARESANVQPRAELVEIDRVGPDRVGFDAWAILELDWGPHAGWLQQGRPRNAASADP